MNKGPTDLRRFAKTTNFRLILGSLILLLTVGVGLIYLIYGPEAAVMSLICLAGAFVPILLIVLLLYIIDRIVKHANPE